MWSYVLWLTSPAIDWLIWNIGLWNEQHTNTNRNKSSDTIRLSCICPSDPVGFCDQCCVSELSCSPRSLIAKSSTIYWHILLHGSHTNHPNTTGCIVSHIVTGQSHRYLHLCTLLCPCRQCQIVVLIQGKCRRACRKHQNTNSYG